MTLALFMLLGSTLAVEPTPSALRRQADRLLQQYQPLLVCTHQDSPWKIMHVMLVKGPRAPVYQSSHPIRALCWLRTCISRGKPFLQTRGQCVVPQTDPEPRFEVQDHHNQLLAYVSQVGVTRATYDATAESDLELDGRPGWDALLRGAWEEAYRPECELSWTLVCYVHYFVHFHVALDVKRSRLAEVVRTVATRDVAQGACEGAHALGALAMYLRSDVSKEMPHEINRLAQATLESKSKAIIEKLTSVSKKYLAGEMEMPKGEATELIIASLGHHIEWLALYLNRDDLTDEGPRICVAALLTALEEQTAFRPSNYGSLCHALHGIQIYAARSN